MFDIPHHSECDYQTHSELQNAYALSVQERPQDHRISQEIAKGKFVLIDCQPQFCPRTDAMMPHSRTFVSSHDTYQEAEEAMNKSILEFLHSDEGFYTIEPKPVSDYEYSEVPF